MQPLPHDWGQAPPPRSRCFFHREVWHSWSLSTFHFPGEMAQFNQISELKEDELSIYSQHRSLLFFFLIFFLLQVSYLQGMAILFCSMLGLTILPLSASELRREKEMLLIEHIHRPHRWLHGPEN